MTLRFETTVQMFTPLWTAGATGKSDRLHETGIIGSLRWWYEAIIRGVGGSACDPTTEGQCSLSGKERNDNERETKLCPACWLFGCGGWKRRFRLVAKGSLAEPFLLTSLFYKNELNEDVFNRWWLREVFNDNLNDKLVFGPITLTFFFPDKDGEEVLSQIKALLSVIGRCGSIGAKGQYGFGQFNWGEKMEIRDALRQIREFYSKHTFRKPPSAPDWYSLEKFWFIDLSIPDHNRQIKCLGKAKAIMTDSPSKRPYLPASFDIRYELPSNSRGVGLRQAYYKIRLRESSGNKDQAKEQTREVFGKPRLGTRVFVSHPYKREAGDKEYSLRVWGFTEESVAKEAAKELQNIFELQSEVPYITGLALVNQAQREG
ncbi:MAG: type III-B CRISPR module RAMP protein Cmr1 [Firmicutes bacterium]|nr:type III-B CRISPR module RAMP protein Cmr1 [Bacillota bacterium]